MVKYEYLMPETLDEAISNFMEHPGDAKYIAGGTDLMNAIKAGEMKPQYLISLRHIKALRQITRKDGKLRIGSMVTHGELERSTALKTAFSGLVDAVSNIGTVQIRNVVSGDQEPVPTKNGFSDHSFSGISVGDTVLMFFLRSFSKNATNDTGIGGLLPNPRYPQNSISEP